VDTVVIMSNVGRSLTVCRRSNEKGEKGILPKIWVFDRRYSTEEYPVMVKECEGKTKWK